MADPNAEGSSEFITMIRRIMALGMPMPATSNIGVVPVLPTNVPTNVPRPRRSEAVAPPPARTYQVYQNPVFDNSMPMDNGVHNENNTGIRHNIQRPNNWPIPMFQPVPIPPRNLLMGHNPIYAQNMAEPLVPNVPNIAMPNQVNKLHG